MTGRIHNSFFAIGVTGGIACGKSTAARRAAEISGGLFFGADEAVRELLESPDVQTQLRVAFPAAFPGGVFSKKLLRELVFEETGARKALEAILHPLVYELCDKARGEALEKHRPFFAEIPLLYETEAQNRFDGVWVVAASPDRSLQRLLERPGITSALACEMSAAQWPLAEKIRLADVVLWNDGPPSCLDSQILDALRVQKLVAAGGS